MDYQLGISGDNILPSVLSPLCIMKQRNFVERKRSGRGGALGASIRKSPLHGVYKTWHGMRNRCSDERSPAWKHYGGRGISVCAEWDVFANFYRDMGKKPSKEYSLDRIDMNGNYSKENCRWATWHEQANNKRNNSLITAFGKTQTAAQWSAELGLNYHTIKARMLMGWKESDILAPVEKENVWITRTGVTKTLAEWSRESGLKASTINARRRAGWKENEWFVPLQKGLTLHVGKEKRHV